MKEKINKYIIPLFIILIFFFISISLYSENLLTNPGAESGNMSGWTVIQNGGNGWAVSHYQILGGNYCYITSYGWDKKSQTIDLLSKGYTAAELDAAPKIYVECWAAKNFSTNPDDYFYLYVSLKNITSTELASYNTGEKIVSSMTGVKYSYTFTGYSAGLRYIYFENWGKDGENWAGNYGVIIDNELVLVDRTGNDSPYIMIEGYLNYTEQSEITVISNNAIVKDIDSNDFNNGRLIIDFLTGGTPYDSLSIRHQGTGLGQIGVSGNNVYYSGVNFGIFSGGTTGIEPLVIVLNANSGDDTVAALIKNILYKNRSDAPPAVQTLRLQLCDGDGDTGQITQTINLTNVNDSPILYLPSDSITINPNITSSLTFTSANITDSDAADTIYNIAVTISDTELVRVEILKSAQGYDTFYFTALLDTTAVDTITIKISDSSGAFDTKLFVVYILYTNKKPNTPVLISPINLSPPYTEYDIYGRTLNLRPILIWYCPIDADSDRLHFKVYCDTGNGNTLLAYSILDTSGFTYYNNGNYDSFPITGVDSNVYGNTICYKPQSNLNETIYCWTVQAFDSKEFSDSALIRHFRIGGRNWTDNNILAGTTFIRKLHIEELREEINYARKFRGLNAFDWTDATIIAGETLIRKIHIVELRTASEQAADAAKERIPNWTDSNITEGNSLIRKIHFDELRQKLSEY